MMWDSEKWTLRLVLVHDEGGYVMALESRNEPYKTTPICQHRFKTEGEAFDHMHDRASWNNETNSLWFNMSDCSKQRSDEMFKQFLDTHTTD